MGGVQILVANRLSAGYKNVKIFISSLCIFDGNYLKSFVGFIKADNRLLKAIREKDWLSFALVYNTPK